MVQLEKLVVSLEARINQYEKALAKAVNTTKRDFRKIEESSARLDTRLARMGRGAFGELARGALFAAAPIISFSVAVDTAKAAMAEFGDIADNAKAAGLDVEFFQGLAHGAQLAGVEMGAFSGALSTFAKNSGLAVEGKGRMVTALKALNPELLANIQAARTQEERLRLAADAIRDAEGASERAALATALFGDAGFKLADAFSGGAAGIDEVVRSARQLGIVVDRELIARAEALGDEFDTATKVLDLQFKEMLVQLIPFLTSTAQAVIGLVNAIKDLWTAVENSNGFQNLQSVTAPLNERAISVMQRQLEDKRAALARSVANPGGAGFFGTGLGVADDQARMRAEIAAIEGAIKARSNPAAFDVNSVVDGLGNSTFGSADAMWAALRGDPGGGGGGGGNSRNDAAEAAVRQAEAVRDLVANLQFEQEQLGRTAEEQELYNALKSAGVTAESAYGQEIKAAMSALQAQRAAIEGNAEAMQALNEAAGQAGQSLKSALEDGKLEAQELLQILAEVAMSMARANFGAAGGANNPALSFLSGLLGFASGTSNTGGARGQVRGVVHGQEAVIPLPNGGRVPVDLRLPGPPSAGGLSQQLTVHVVSDDEKFSAYVTDKAGSVVARASPQIVGAAVVQANKTAPTAVAQHQQQRGGADYRTM